jgi:hypothetical protein
MLSLSLSQQRQAHTSTTTHAASELLRKHTQTYVLKLAKSGSDGEKVFLLLESGTRFHTVQVLAAAPDACTALQQLVSGLAHATAITPHDTTAMPAAPQHTS